MSKFWNVFPVFCMTLIETSISSNECESASRWHQDVCGSGSVWARARSCHKSHLLGFYRACWRQSSIMYGSHNQVGQKNLLAPFLFLECWDAGHVFWRIFPDLQEAEHAVPWKLCGQICPSGSERAWEDKLHDQILLQFLKQTSKSNGFQLSNLTSGESIMNKNQKLAKITFFFSVLWMIFIYLTTSPSSLTVWAPPCFLLFCIFKFFFWSGSFLHNQRLKNVSF